MGFCNLGDFLLLAGTGDERLLRLPRADSREGVLLVAEVAVSADLRLSERDLIGVGVDFPTDLVLLLRLNK